MKTLFLSAVVFLGIAQSSFAQKGMLKKDVDATGIVSSMEFDDINGYQISETPQMFKDVLPLKSDDKLSKYESYKDTFGLVHEKFQHHYKGVKVEYGGYFTHSKKNKIKSMHGDFKVLNIDVNPKLTEKEALQKALLSVDAKLYKWQIPSEEKHFKKTEENPLATYFPKGELLITEKDKVSWLAYKFDIYAAEPFGRYFVYVDALNGDILTKESRICNLNGTAQTRYSGSRTINTTGPPNSYWLRDFSRGQGIITSNMRTGTNIGSAVDFVDNDNNWTSAEFNNPQFDNAALDIHWGLGQTYDYFLNKHGRNSFDTYGKLVYAFVHYGVRYDNAFWDGNYLCFGDGGSVFKPLASLDVVAHEYGHAVNSYSSLLGGSGESGALNEGLSDIWGAVLDANALSSPAKEPWTNGSEIMLANSCLRSLRNPKSEPGARTVQPNYYKGLNWDPNGEVHINAGVLGYWFYLLSTGGVSTNEKGQSYCIEPMSIYQADVLVYQTQKTYFRNNPDINQYVRFKDATIQTAGFIYGVGSYQYKQVVNAWYAVGLSSPYNSFISGPSRVDNTGSFRLTGYDPDGAGIIWSTNSANARIDYQGTLTRLNNYQGIVTVTARVTQGSCPGVYTAYVSLGSPNDHREGITEDLNNESEFTSGITCIPNPSSSGTTITFNNKEANGSLSVINSQGEAVLVFDNLVADKNEVYISTEGLKAGLYIIRLTGSNDEKAVTKLVVTK